MAALVAVDGVRCGVEMAVALGVSPQEVVVLVVLQAGSVQLVVVPLIVQLPKVYVARPQRWFRAVHYSLAES